MYKRKFINMNKVYKVKNRYLGLNFRGVHNVIIIWKNGKRQIARVRTITSLEHPLYKNGKNIMIYDEEALGMAKHGKIVPYSVYELGTKRWSGIYKESHLISYVHLRNAPKGLKKPKSLIKK